MKIKSNKNISELMQSGLVPLNESISNYRMGKIVIGAVIIKKLIMEFLDAFPINAKSWMDATGEVSHIAKKVSEYAQKPIPDTKVNNPSDFNKKYRNFIIDNLDTLTEDQLNRLFTNYEGWFAKNLNESVSEESTDLTKDFKKFVEDKNSHFTFESGYYMEALNSDIFGPNRTSISLLWHKLNLTNADNITEFIQSVEQKLNTHDLSLSDTDKTRLVAHFEKYF